MMDIVVRPAEPHELRAAANAMPPRSATIMGMPTIKMPGGVAPTVPVTAQPERRPFSRSIAGRANSPRRKGRKEMTPSAIQEIVIRRSKGTLAIGAHWAALPSIAGPSMLLKNAKSW